MIDVLCVGHAAWDVIVRVPEFPAEDAKAEATALAESGGGPAANAAYLLSLWGAKCGFAGLVGDDEAGSRIAREFQTVGVDVTGLERRPGHATPVSLVLVSERTGSRTIVTRKATASPLQLLIAAGAEPKVLLFDGHELNASLEAIDRFPHAATILDAGSVREGTRELVRRVSYLVASERFARQFTGLPTLETPAAQTAAVAELYKVNGQPVVITLGSRGLVYGTDVRCEHLPAVPALTVDTTAAGDIFHGAFAYGVLTGLGWDATLKLAATAAALSVEKPGGRASIPTLDRVREALTRAG
ncbi:carbohydrate kinase family protein [Fimbriiglobus ruber]|uniref:Ribokinase n=1 Tax=Fimbriiglobus ruber TaxID=1908690 RepID=A0A225D2X9_9BACT|nr:PfkB family carbohydrate kinase [Fimbriiglobus ruber]OWK35950.1 Ribokinase [Fimbriiglobus ruber]